MHARARPAPFVPRASSRARECGRARDRRDSTQPSTPFDSARTRLTRTRTLDAARDARYAMSFVNRLFSYVFNELMVNALANSRTFQRFAVKSDALMKEAAATDAAEMARRAQQAAQDLSKSVFEQSKGGKGPMGS
jgi:hypothetical protein